MGLNIKNCVIKLIFLYLFFWRGGGGKCICIDKGHWDADLTDTNTIVVCAHIEVAVGFCL